MFEQVQMAPPDAILGLTEAYTADPNPEKVNLGVGVYKDASGKTPVMASVKEAERRILDAQASKSYKPMTGDPNYARLVQELLFEDDSPIVAQGRAVTAHTPGGTGALRVAGDYLKRMHEGATLWLTDPTWANHPAVFAAAGVPTRTYPYYDSENHALALGPMLEALKQAPAGDVVLLHGCCHNPTGMDPSPEQWVRIADVLAERGLVPLIDFAYQGLADGVEQDAAGLRAIADRCPEIFIASSFSKNFGLYNERSGALTVVAADAGAADAVISHVKLCIRTNYSNPPAHGGEIVTTVLNDEELHRQWESEVKDIRDRINGMRALLVQTLAEKGVSGDYSFITDQRGMFSLSGLTKPQVEKLRKDYSIYIVGSGRINVAGMTAENMPRLCEAIRAVT